MVRKIKRVNEMNSDEVQISDSQYITILKDRNVYVSDYNDNVINYTKTEYAKVYWYLNLIEKQDEITSFIPKIVKIDFKMNNVYFKNPNAIDEDDDESYDKIEEFTIFSKDIKVENLDVDEIRLPFKPRSINLYFNSKKVEIEF